MSNETSSANKRLYYRLQGEINCLKKLIEVAAQGDFTVCYKYLVNELRAMNSKLTEVADRSRNIRSAPKGE